MYVDVAGSIDIKMSDFTISTVSAGISGGLIYLRNSTMTGNLVIAMSSGTVTTATAGQSGGVIYAMLNNT